ncbi:MAG: L-threonylcarbamoyladenylate synthase [Syntrophomonadaceae bacterium]|nr:L-threonylcarbamoyladenylate synthase [Syntrophomonadaceae bacterium]
MQTQYFKVNPKQPEAEIIALAARLIISHELVAFPTETVYGLGAGAYYPEAVNKIFIAKQRPAANPLLVHVSNITQVGEMVLEVPPVARLLMDKFWPGPLSIVLPARDTVPLVVRGGKNSVGLRMPDHPVALALIEAAGPIAAPSANLSGRPSPVTAAHVKDDLNGRIAAVLDAGPTGLGLESTIIDFSQGRLQLIRRGAVDLEILEDIAGEKLALPDSEENGFTHHQISAEVEICENEECFQQQLDKILRDGRKLAIVYNNAGGSAALPRVADDRISASYVLDVKAGSSNLYSILRDVEQIKADILIFAPLSSECSGIAATLWERIKQAARKIGR